MVATASDLSTIWRGDAAYEAARRATCRNQHLPDRFPALIVQALCDADVAAAVRLAKQQGFAISMCSGGHSWSCNHVREGGMLIDLSRLDAVEIDADAMVAKVGPGVRGNALDALLETQGLFFPVGHCYGVGLGGYLLQGGFGWCSRVLGMACESVLGIDYVDADGTLRHASEHENAEVLWAARGSGPGFFGVVVRFHLRLVRRPPVIGGALAFYPGARFGAIIRWAQSVGSQVPASVELMFVFSRDAAGEAGVMMIAAVFAETEADAMRDLAFLDARPDGALEFKPFKPNSLAVLTEMTMSHYPEGHNHIVDNLWTHASGDALLPALSHILDDAPAVPCHFIWMNWSPKRRRPDMAFSLEDETYIAIYGIWQDPAHENRVATWVEQGIARLQPFSTGIQLADENLARRAAPFMAPENHARLEALRVRHDPDARFHTYAHAGAGR